MRFYKAVQNICASEWSRDTITEGEVICFSHYFSSLQICSDGKNKTRFLYSPYRWRLNMILSGKIIPLKESELNKIKPHLKRENIKYDV